MNDPHLLPISIARYASPETVAESMRHYVDGRGKATTIGTAWGLTLLRAALGFGEVGEPPARIRQTDVPYLDIPSLAITFPRTEGETSFGVVLSPGGVCYDRTKPYCIPWLRIASIDLQESPGETCLRIWEMTDLQEIEAFLTTDRRPPRLLRHEIPLIGYAIPADLIEAVIRYYRLGQGNTITIGGTSNLAQLCDDFGQGSQAEVERAKLEEWLIQVVRYPVGPDYDEDDTDEDARQWALHAPYDELSMLLEILARKPNLAVDKVFSDLGYWDYSVSLVLAHWGRRDLSRFCEMVVPYLRAPRARPALLMSFGVLGTGVLPWLNALVQEVTEWPEGDVELLADSLFEIGGAEAQTLLWRLHDVSAGIALYLARHHYLENKEAE